MGFPKMLLNFNGSTMLENVILNVTGSEIKNVMVVLGAEREQLTDLVKKLPVRFCYNENYRDGMLSSVICGLRNLPSETEAVMVFQGDQPLITTSVINMLIKRYSYSEKGIVIPVYKGKRGHPVLIGKKHLDKIEYLDSSQGLRSLALQVPYDVLEVETDDRGILRDFDTYDDYIKETNQIC